VQTQKLSEQVLTILSTAEINGLTVCLTCGQLDRKLYQDVNSALEALGGKWNRKTRGHDFQNNPKEKLENAILTGKVTPPNKNGYFPTPKPIVQKLIVLAQLSDGMTVLEPSAGKGAIADQLRVIGFEPYCCEILPENIKVLKEKGYQVFEDFLKWNKPEFDRIIMNPPFEMQADIMHVTHAFNLLREKGIVVSVMASGVVFRQDKKAVAFRKLIEENNGEIIKLPEDSFKESGTSVNTVIVVIPKNKPTLTSYD
jgi:predicted RNA methylase